ncbi:MULTISPECIES: hypothetical protein [Rhizobium/Agrobacterium group]|nr:MULTISPECIES: hypothetical protein [Rhizobium/Agrobacterium group]QWW77657.1 hypothetical protein KP800_26370 [Agrobacterium pusense]
MSDIEWRWVSAGFISGGGTSEKEPHFKKDWVSFLIEVTEFELTYMLRANDRGYDDLPEFPLSHHGMEDIKAAQAERITPILNDGHYIRGKGKIVDDNIMWSNFAKGTPGGDKDETINQTFSEVEFTIWPGDRFGELRVSRPEYRDEPYRLLANLQLPQTRIDSLAEMAHRYGADARMKISLLASLFYYRNGYSEYASTYLMPAMGANNAEAVISHASVTPADRNEAEHNLLMATYEQRRTTMLQAFSNGSENIHKALAYAYQERMAPTRNRSELEKLRRPDPFEAVYAIPSAAVEAAEAFIVHNWDNDAPEKIAFPRIEEAMAPYRLRRWQVGSILQYFWLSRLFLKPEVLAAVRIDVPFECGGIGEDFKPSDVVLDC